MNYRNLLADVMPVAIDSDEEYERLLSAAERFLEKGEQMTPEEDRLVQMLAILLEEYENREFPVTAAPAPQMLQFLMDMKGVEARDLLPVLQSNVAVTEIVSGRRSITAQEARRLAEFFEVSPKVFLNSELKH
jgi:HTH-type transcriptional regulator / antitoxin HigA